mgnify:CR=1 FL=1
MCCHSLNVPMRFRSSPVEVVVCGARLQWGAVDGNVAKWFRKASVGTKLAVANENEKSALVDSRLSALLSLAYC